MPNLLSPRQIRGARAMLGWSMVDLAKAAGMSISTVKSVEDGARPASPAMSGPIQCALEAAGIRFLPDEGDGDGLRLRAG